MAKNQTRRNFLRSAPLAAAAVGLPFSERLAAAAMTPEPFQLIKADRLVDAMAKLHATPGNENLYESKTLPMTVVMTTENKKAGKEFEYHEGRDHIFQILDGSAVYELGGTPTNPRNTKPGEWLAPASAGAASVTVSKGDMLIVPPGTPHKRTTENSVTFILITSTGSTQA